MMGKLSMGGVAGSSREGEGEGKVKSKETSAARLHFDALVHLYWKSFGVLLLLCVC